MKIDDVVAGAGKGGSTRARVLAYLEEHTGDVFRIRQCEQIAQALGGVPKRTVEHVLWSLHKDGLIGKARLGQEIWYGAHSAIDDLISAQPAVRI